MKGTGSKDRAYSVLERSQRGLLVDGLHERRNGKEKANEWQNNEDNSDDSRPFEIIVELLHSLRHLVDLHFHRFYFLFEFCIHRKIISCYTIVFGSSAESRATIS